MIHVYDAGWQTEVWPLGVYRYEAYEVGGKPTLAQSVVGTSRGVLLCHGITQQGTLRAARRIIKRRTPVLVAENCEGEGDDR
jgi:hypothetical protein